MKLRGYTTQTGYATQTSYGTVHPVTLNRWRIQRPAFLAGYLFGAVFGFLACWVAPL